MAEDPADQSQAHQSKKSTGKGDGALQSLAQVEKLVQLGILIPVATLVGWFCGAALDRFFHTHWIYLVGLLLGAAAGFVQMFRTVLQNTKE